MAGARPCFPSAAWAREFERLVRYLLTDALLGNEPRVRSMAQWLAGLSGHDADALARCALADAVHCRELSHA